MTSTLTFTTRNKNRTAPNLTFTLDGDDYEARCPKIAHWVQLLASTAGRSAEQARAIGVFFDVCLTETDAAQIERRLRNHDDHLDQADLMNVLNALVEEWDPYMAEEMADAGMDDPRAANRAQRRDTQVKRRPVTQTKRTPTNTAV